MIAVDTNVLVRLLTGDEPKQTAAARVANVPRFRRFLARPIASDSRRSCVLPLSVIEIVCANFWARAMRLYSAFIFD